MTNRVLIGKFPDGNYGVRVSKPGYDVTSNPVDNEQLAFNSDWSYMLPVLLGGTAVVNATTVTVNFGFDLGYIPFCSAFIVDPSFTYLHHSTNSMEQTPSIFDYWTEGSASCTQIDVGTFSDRLVLRTNGNRTIKYTVYRLKAF